jgi:SAM-dependent methyltransferase
MDNAVAIEVFWELHTGLAQQGPGSDASTRRALALVPGLPPDPRILDLGCGSGRQTLVLARETGGFVTAVDLHAPFLRELSERARIATRADRIETVEASMDDLPYADERFDLLWSEGAIYNIGFRNGLQSWRRLLRPGGALAVTEATWLRNEPPQLVRDFWRTNYPAMQDRAANERDIAECGYQLLGSFALPETDWWDDYYTPIEAGIEKLRKQRSDDRWNAALAAAEDEIAIFRSSGGSYGYVFYVMQRRDE